MDHLGSLLWMPNTSNFHVGNPRLFAGFHGSINSFGVESIGVYVKSNISSIVNPKVPSVKSEKEEDNK